MLSQVMRVSGFEHVVCLLVPSAAPGGAADCASRPLLDTRPLAWVEAYNAGQCADSDPFLHEGSRRIDTFSWADVLDKTPGAAAAPAVVLARQFGMSEGLVVPVINEDRRAGLVIAAGRSVDPRPERRRTLSIAAIVAFHRLLALRRAAAPPANDVLSAREAEVLHWIMVGKSDWQVGKILTISSKTVNYHIENVKRKFGVATRMQAVVAALKSGAVCG